MSYIYYGPNFIDFGCFILCDTKTQFLHYITPQIQINLMTYIIKLIDFTIKTCFKISSYLRSWTVSSHLFFWHWPLSIYVKVEPFKRIIRNLTKIFRGICKNKLPRLLCILLVWSLHTLHFFSQSWHTTWFIGVVHLNYLAYCS